MEASEAYDANSIYYQHAPIEFDDGFFLTSIVIHCNGRIFYLRPQLEDIDGAEKKRITNVEISHYPDQFNDDGTMKFVDPREFPPQVRNALSKEFMRVIEGHAMIADDALEWLITGERHGYAHDLEDVEATDASVAKGAEAFLQDEADRAASFEDAMNQALDVGPDAARAFAIAYEASDGTQTAEAILQQVLEGHGNTPPTDRSYRALLDRSKDLETALEREEFAGHVTDLPDRNSERAQQDFYSQSTDKQALELPETRRTAWQTREDWSTPDLCSSVKLVVLHCCGCFPLCVQTHGA